MVNNQKAQNPIPTYDSDFNRNLKKAGDKYLISRSSSAIFLSLSFDVSA
jgi:hypothetical protein